MSTFLHQARLIEVLLELGEVEAATRIARLHADDLCAALKAAEGSGDLDAARPGDSARQTAQTERRHAVVPSFVVAVAGAVEGRVVVGATVNAASPEDERRAWRFALDHPVVGAAIRELLSSVAWTDELEQTR